MRKPDRYAMLVTAKDPRTGVERELRVGPILQHRSVLDDYCAIVNRGVAEGKEKQWRDARVIKLDRIVV